MKNLIAIKDAHSTPIWARIFSDNTSGKYAQALTLYEVDVPSDADIVIFGAGQAYMASQNSFTPPAAVGSDIPNGVHVNPGSIWVKEYSKIYYAAFSEGLVNLEFYRKIGGAN